MRDGTGFSGGFAKLIGRAAAPLLGAADVGSRIVAEVIGRPAGRRDVATVTISRPRDDVERFWRQADNLSRVMGDLADVAVVGPNRYRWTFHPPGDDDVIWETQLVETADGVRFRGRGGRFENSVAAGLDFAEAPASLGTEVRLWLDLPVPGAIGRAAAFTVLYRARALLQTGEVSTLTATPAARSGRR